MTDLIVRIYRTLNIWLKHLMLILIHKRSPPTKYSWESQSHLNANIPVI